MSTFLLVDDDKAIVSLMSRMLTLTFPECIILTATNGEDGLTTAFNNRPDVIMLDVTLPKMDGLEVCQQLKSDPRTASTPVIMITGDHTGSANRIIGLEVGADSYLYKPFIPEEFAAQVRAMLRIKQAEEHLRSQKEVLEAAFRDQTIELQQNKEALQIKVQELEKLMARQTQELIRADRLASLGIMAAGIAHEVNNPNTFISSNLQTFRMFWNRIEQAIEKTVLPDELIEQISFIRHEMPGLIKGMEEGTRRIAGIVSGMKSYATGSNESYRVVDLVKAVAEALQLVHNQLKHDIEVINLLPPELPKVFGSEQLLCQVFVNLFINAARVMKESRGSGAITISGNVSDDGHVTIHVADNGPGIKPEHMKHLFNPFFTTRREKGGTGLGLFVSHGIIKGHNGQIDVESELGKGTSFSITLPAAELNTPAPIKIDVPNSSAIWKIPTE